MTESPKPDSAKNSLGPLLRRDRSVAAQRAARLNKAKREGRIIGLLNRGVSVAEIDAREDLSPKRLRNLVREILANRMPQPPAEFVALQISRLNEALLVSYSAMQAPENLRLAAPSQTPLALEAQIAERLGDGAASD